MGNIVRENIEFKRGQEPRDALGLGLQSIANNISHEEFGAITSLIADENDKFGNFDWWVHEGNLDPGRMKSLSDLFRGHLRYSHGMHDIGGPKGAIEEKKLIELMKKERQGAKYIYGDPSDEDYVIPIYTDIKFPNVYPGRRDLSDTFELNESIEFKRGRDPKQSLGIGIEDSLYDIADELGVRVFQQERKENGELTFEIFAEKGEGLTSEEKVRDWIYDWSIKHDYHYELNSGLARLPDSGRLGYLLSYTFK